MLRYVLCIFGYVRLQQEIKIIASSFSRPEGYFFGEKNCRILKCYFTLKRGLKAKFIGVCKVRPNRIGLDLC